MNIPDQEFYALKRWCLNLAESALQLERALETLAQNSEQALEATNEPETMNHPDDHVQALRDSVNGFE